MALRGNHLHLIVRNRPDVFGQSSRRRSPAIGLLLRSLDKPKPREVAKTHSRIDLCFLWIVPWHLVECLSNRPAWNSARTLLAPSSTMPSPSPSPVGPGDELFQQGGGKGTAPDSAWFIRGCRPDARQLSRATLAWPNLSLRCVPTCSGSVLPGLPQVPRERGRHLRPRSRVGAGS